MRIDIELPDTHDTVTTDAPTVPRIGEQILWTDETTDARGTYERMREYRVTMVDWSMSPGKGEGTAVRLLVEPIPDTSGLPHDSEQETTTALRSRWAEMIRQERELLQDARTYLMKDPSAQWLFTAVNDRFKELGNLHIQIAPEGPPNIK